MFEESRCWDNLRRARDEYFPYNIHIGGGCTMRAYPLVHIRVCNEVIDSIVWNAVDKLNCRIW